MGSRHKYFSAAILMVAMLGAVATVAAILPLYPGAKLDQEYERTKYSYPNIDSKQYTTSDSFDKVAAFYNKLAPEAPEWKIDQPGHKRSAFREKGDGKNSTTIEWSNENPGKTFILVNSHK